MRRSLLLTLLLTSIFFLNSCKANSSLQEQQIISNEIKVKYPSNLISVGFIQTGKESDWRITNTNDFLRTFTEKNGYYLIYINGNSDPKRQVKAMLDLVKQKVDYIIVDPIVEDGWESAMKAAKDAGIPVIVTDRNINVDKSLYKCWIGSNFQEEGEKAIIWLEKYLKENGRTNEELNIVILEGTKGASASIGRSEGIRKRIALHSNWHILTSVSANFTQGEGQNAMEDILNQFNDIDVLIAENDNMMFGAMEAMDNHGKSYGVNGQVITISFDAVYEAFEKMMDKKLHASVECNPYLAQMTHEIIMELNSGKDIEKVYYSIEEVFSYKNAYQYINTRQQDFKD